MTRNLDTTQVNLRQFEEVKKIFFERLFDVKYHSQFIILNKITECLY